MRTISVFVFILLIVNMGCGGPQLPEGMPKPNPTKIKILVDGAPIEGAVIMSYPTDKTLSKWGGGGGSFTNASGVVEMYSRGAKGLVAGEAVITVNKYIIEQHPGDETGKSDIYEYFVDTKYWSTETSPLKITVEPGKNEFTLNVEPFDERNYDFQKYRKKLKKKS